MNLIEKEQQPINEEGKTVSKKGQAQAWISMVISQFTLNEEETKKSTEAYLKDPWARPLGH